MAKKPGVSVVIPSYNCKRVLFRLLNSLKKSDYSNVANKGSSLEVIVVDNGSRDGTLMQGRERYPWVHWVDAGDKNIGQTGAYNLGFAHAKKGNHVMMIDSDVVVNKNTITRMVERLESNPKIGIVTPMILYLDDKNWVNQAGSHVDLRTGRVKVGWGPKEEFLKAKRVQNSGTVMLFRNEVLRKIGGFDDWFLCYFDPDYCLRAERAGFETWYEPEAICYHDQSKDPEVWRPRVLSRAYLLGRNRVLFMRRHGNLLIFTFSLPLLLGYYLLETIKYRQVRKFLELAWGSIVGFFYPLRKRNYIPLPKLSNARSR